MGPGPRLVLEQLKDAPILREVGGPASDNVIVVASFEEAIALASTPQWEGIQLNAANQLRSLVSLMAPHRFNRWNEVVQEIRPEVESLVATKVLPVVRSFSNSKGLVDNIHWDWLHLCLEQEYADLVPPAFYTGLSYWYSRGRFPCGWEGNYPEGKLVVY